MAKVSRAFEIGFQRHRVVMRLILGGEDQRHPPLVEPLPQCRDNVVVLVQFLRVTLAEFVPLVRIVAEPVAQRRRVRFPSSRRPGSNFSFETPRDHRLSTRMRCPSDGPGGLYARLSHICVIGFAPFPIQMLTLSLHHWP